MKQGKVMLVGAGPGDEKLITVKGMEAICRADVILYDRLANPKLLTYAKDGCELIYGGKLPKRHFLRQEAINQALVEKALEGKLVVRLKGGDPNVFGRVGEEAEALAQYGIPFEIVPGITSGIAAPAYAGIPVTHREFGGSFAVVTAHDKSKDGKPSINWEGLASGVDTIAFYMGVANLSYICDNLKKHGKSPGTPVILIQWGTFGRQQTLEGTLDTIAEKAEAVQFKNPAITLVGDIVSLRDKTKWFEKKPLHGRQILLARTGVKKSDLAEKLTEQGADVFEFPKMKNVRIPTDTSRKRVLENIETYETIIFSSPESIEIFFEDLFKAGKDIRSIKANLFGGSSKSVRELNKCGFQAEVAGNLNAIHSGEPALIVGEDSIYGQRWFFALQYDQYELFTTHVAKVDESYFPIFKRMIEDAELNTVIFPCAKSAGLLKDALKQAGMDADAMLAPLQAACFGEQSGQAARRHGIINTSIAESPDAEGIISLLDKTNSQCASVEKV
ncbi:uroporphyrinogen-III C-methyltransferase [Bacillus marinisedimentorum]|uniref:uroporphyrinogen-III C-methyltransferase n=1 Tax=Bacillus marinisedimentorum TaxID=1821260 RepID=UPI0008729B98|nr:uroporphyrinogen-III C-methyltransferase [Bacillus marinisedimentorum]